MERQFSPRYNYLLINGAIYDGLHAEPFDYLRVSGNHIAEIGRGPVNREGTEVIDLRRRSITPAIIDSHLHLLDYAWSLARVNLDGCHSIEEVTLRLQQRAETAVPGEWVLGRGWIRSLFDEGWPHRKFLDDIFPEHPVALNSRDGHFLWANSAALAASGLQKPADVPGGYIGKDAKGQLDGIFGEQAVELITKNIPAPGKDSRIQSLLTAQRKLHSMGVVGLHSTDGNQAFGDLQNLHTESLLKLRIFHSIPLSQLENAVALSLQSGLGDRWLRFGFVKIFSDGALGPQSACMLEPYENSDSTGIEVLSEAELSEKLRLALQHGIAAGVHAIGDRANRQVLHAFRQNREWLKVPSARSRIEHVQLIHPDDMSEFRELGVLASMQPFHAISDYDLAMKHWGSRAQYSYAWRALHDSGAMLIFGSDAPIEDPDPLPGLHAAVHRHNWSDRSQTISPYLALKAYTSNPAFAANELHYHGTLEPGKLADFLIFSEDPIRSQFQDVRVEGTVIEGEFVYREFE